MLCQHGAHAAILLMLFGAQPRAVRVHAGRDVMGAGCWVLWLALMCTLFPALGHRYELL